MTGRWRGRRWLVRALTIVGLLLPWTLLWPVGPALAHPLGNFTVNTFAGLRLAPGRLEVDYVLDLAEVPTFQERSRMDRDGDGALTEAEQRDWAWATARRMARGLEARVDGRPVALAPVEVRVALLPGQAGLSVLRLEVAFEGGLAGSGRLEFSDRNFPDRPGWREVTAVGEDGLRLVEASVPPRSVSGRLTAYPQGLLSSPVRVTEATLRFSGGSAMAGAAAAPAAGPGPERGAVAIGPGPEAGGAAWRPGGAGALASLVALDRLSPAVVALALFAALGLGALHALAPGHGKTIIAGYLVGAEVGVRQAAGAALAVALMHTASVLALGMGLVVLERSFPAERLYPWLGLAAGLVAVLLGAGLLVSRTRAWRTPLHPHAHPHPHGLSRRTLAALALSGGILPSPSAVVVLLGAVALHRTAFGLALVAAFGLGLAGSLLAVGAVATRARALVAVRLGGGRARALPLLGAGAVLVAGAVVALRAGAQLL
ncbi:MAG TPA: nickel transporter [Actinomycetota bacterium]|nr:nickel transporter [Actinomycetota bacterium]